MEQRKPGVQFRRDADGAHQTSINVRTVNAAVAFLLQLAALITLLWGIMEWKIVPMIDARIDQKLTSSVAQIRANSDYIIQHRAEVAVGMRQMEEYRLAANSERIEIMDELRYIRARVDALYEKRK